MDVQTFYPENPLLQEWIEYYYFLKTDSSDFESSYYVFPNTLQAFNIHRFARCSISSHSTSVWGDKTNPYMLIAQGKHEVPLLVHLRGMLDKVTIVFKPLGINHFIKKAYLAILPASSQVFTDWDEDEKCGPFLDSFYQTENNGTKIQLLEAYLLSHYQPIKNEAVLQQALSLLADFHTEHSVEEIRKRLGMTTRTFNRIFYKNLGISPVSYRKIARFRHSLQNKIFSDHFKKLTQVGYESNFHDQSYFIKMYKTITGDNPSMFFHSIEKLADKQLIFKFISR